MKTKTQHIERRFQRHLDTMNGALPALEQRIEQLPKLQVSELQDRLLHIEVMETAIRRNIHEVLETKVVPPVERVRKLKSLARLIEAEMETLRHEADFMAMGSPTTFESVANGTDHFIKKARELLRALGSLRDKE
jgi:uncharacterized protein Yka (UPF0111/DUF47 family)